MKILLGRMAYREPWWSEWWSAFAAIAWCIFAAVFSSGLEKMQSFNLVTTVAPVWVWYTFCVVFPVGQIVALRKDQRMARLAFCAVMAWWWSFLSFAVAVGSPDAPGLVLYITFALVNLHSLYRLRSE